MVDENMIMIGQTSKPNTSHGVRDRLVLVLWGKQFEEATAAIFTTKFRQSGLCVKVVGLAGMRLAGKNGLAMYPDMTLGEALAVAEQVVGIVLPCSISMLKQSEADPRLVELFNIAYQNGAKFVISTAKAFDESRLGRICLANESILNKPITSYGDQVNLLQFAEELGTELSNGCKL